MDTTSNNKQKGVINGISGNSADKEYRRVFDGESKNQAPPPIHMAK
jgi:hypothetical protein